MTIYKYISAIHEMNSLSRLDRFDPNDKELFDRRFMSVHTWRFVNTVEDTHIFEYAMLEEAEND